MVRLDHLTVDLSWISGRDACSPRSTANDLYVPRPFFPMDRHRGSSGFAGSSFLSLAFHHFEIDEEQTQASLPKNENKVCGPMSPRGLSI
ncbi:MAG: hypothetical protein A2Z37_00730 [Chloroflexi bacterium RBG_19FT_COMBO_62_14]|nr:MAG: hypothetical protein A2Z37_00730 [Chloroflexi bacterium RBG_19FT_COMBO_62_14]